MQLKAGQSALARKTWQDFFPPWKDKAAGNDAEAIKSYLSRAEYRLAHTYGLPQPSSVGDLELAVAAAEKFLANHPEHELAPKAELEIARGLFAARATYSSGRSAESLIDNPNYKDSEAVSRPRGRCWAKNCFAQAKFDEAIAAWKEFLEQHPTDPSGRRSKSGSSIPNTPKPTRARNKKYDDARTIWQTFLNKYPLDARAPAILFQFGQMKYLTKRSSCISSESQPHWRKANRLNRSTLDDPANSLFEEAIADWRRVVSKYPEQQRSIQASYMIGVTLEDRLGKLKAGLGFVQASERAVSLARQHNGSRVSPRRNFRSSPNANSAVTKSLASS